MSHTISLQPQAQQVQLPGAPGVESSRTAALRALGNTLGIVSKGIASGAQKFQVGRFTALEEQAKLNPGQTVKEAIDTGLIKEVESDTFRGFLNTARGSNAGELYVQEFTKAFNASPARNSEDSNEYAEFVSDFEDDFLERQENQTPEFRAGLKPFQDQIHQNKLNEHIGIVSRNMRSEALDAVANETRKALLSPGVRQPIIQLIREGSRKFVLTDKQTAIAMAEGAIAAAIEKNDASLLEALEIGGIGGGPSIVKAFPEVRKLIDDTKSKISSQDHKAMLSQARFRDDAIRQRRDELIEKEMRWLLLTSDADDGVIEPQLQDELNLLTEEHFANQAELAGLTSGTFAQDQEDREDAVAAVFEGSTTPAIRRRRKSEILQAEAIIEVGGSDLNPEFWAEHSKWLPDELNSRFVRAMAPSPVLKDLTKSNYVFREGLTQARNTFNSKLTAEIGNTRQQAQQEASRALVTAFTARSIDVVRSGQFEANDTSPEYTAWVANTLRELTALGIEQLKFRSELLTLENDVVLVPNEVFLSAESREAAKEFASSDKLADLRTTLSELKRLVATDDFELLLRTALQTNSRIMDFPDAIAASRREIIYQMSLIIKEIEGGARGR